MSNKIVRDRLEIQVLTHFDMILVTKKKSEFLFFCEYLDLKW